MSIDAGLCAPQGEAGATELAAILGGTGNSLVVISTEIIRDGGIEKLTPLDAGAPGIYSLVNVSSETSEGRS